MYSNRYFGVQVHPIWLRFSPQVTGAEHNGDEHGFRRDHGPGRAKSLANVS